MPGRAAVKVSSLTGSLRLSVCRSAGPHRYDRALADAIILIES
jgi:hypothetical protein